MTEKERQRKKEMEREGATGKTKRGPCLNGQTQLTVVGSREPLSVRVGVMPVEKMQVQITLDFKYGIHSYKTGIKKKRTAGNDFYQLCMIKNQTNVLVFIAHRGWLTRRPTHMAACWHLPLTICNPQLHGTQNSR